MSEDLARVLLIGVAIMGTGALFELALWAAYRGSRAHCRKRDRR